MGVVVLVSTLSIACFARVRPGRSPSIFCCLEAGRHGNMTQNRFTITAGQDCSGRSACKKARAPEGPSGA